MHSINASCLCGPTIGFPVWDAIADDAKLLHGDNAAYIELVLKYGEKAVEDRRKFLAEAECD